MNGLLAIVKVEVMVRAFFKSLVLSIILFGFLWLGSTVIVNSRATSLRAVVLRHWAPEMDRQYRDRWPDLKRQALERARFYDDQIEQRFLVDGMVVHQGRDGYLHECDSLLFSSLRFVALSKLGWEERAEKAWQALERSQKQGQWFRHPRCHLRTSRDMIVGLFAALTQNPENGQRYLEELSAYIKRNDGYLGVGPFYVSFMTPGIGQALSHLVDADTSLPTLAEYGFSTLEFDTFLANEGYQSHLNALIIWIELELWAQRGQVKSLGVASLLDPLYRPFTFESLADQRNAWVAQRLFDGNPDNLFYRWLTLKTARALNTGVRSQLLDRLLSMPQFPQDRMPSNCDRRADYLWQRAQSDYLPVTMDCDVEFNAVDFLWMTALILDDVPTLLSVDDHRP